MITKSSWLTQSNLRVPSSTIFMMSRTYKFQCSAFVLCRSLLFLSLLCHLLDLAEVADDVADSSAVGHEGVIALATIVTSLAAEERAGGVVRTTDLADDVGERVSVHARKLVPAEMLASNLARLEVGTKTQ